MLTNPAPQKMTKWSTGLAWLLLTMPAWFIALFLLIATLIVELSYSANGSTVFASGQGWAMNGAIRLALEIVLLFIAGSVVGFFQWLYLRRHINSSGWWILATAAGIAVVGIGIRILSLGVGQLLLASSSTSVSTGIDDMAGDLLFLILIIGGLFIFSGLALLQWLVIRKSIRFAWAWIPVKLSGLLMGCLAFAIVAFPFVAGYLMAGSQLTDPSSRSAWVIYYVIATGTSMGVGSTFVSLIASAGLTGLAWMKYHIKMPEMKRTA